MAAKKGSGKKSGSKGGIKKSGSKKGGVKYKPTRKKGRL